MIRQHYSEKWSLWHLGPNGHLSLHYRDKVGEVEFDTPEALIEYCRQVTDAAPQWAYFRERVFRGLEHSSFPVDLGDRKKWSKGVGAE